MKYVLLVFAFFYVSFAVAQDQTNESSFNLESLKVEIKVDSLKDLKVFKVSDVKDVFREAEPNSELVFTLVCQSNKNDLSLTKSYEIKGNSNEKRDFMKMIKKLKRSAKNYYKNNN